MKDNVRYNNIIKLTVILVCVLQLVSAGYKVSYTTTAGECTTAENDCFQCGTNYYTINCDKNNGTTPCYYQSSTASDCSSSSDPIYIPEADCDTTSASCVFTYTKSSNLIVWMLFVVGILIIIGIIIGVAVYALKRNNVLCFKSQNAGNLDDYQ